jgi:hypothetical protein
MLTELQSLVKGFEIIHLQDMKQIAFNERIDIKFLFSIRHLPWLINEITPFYRILEVEGILIQPYKTVYYDTLGFRLYLDHHNGKLNRFKLRKRLYIANNISFSEIKFKSNKGITFKKRVSTDQNLEALNEVDHDFFDRNTNLSSKDLVASATNYFNRITLVSRSDSERVTMDFNLKLERKGVIADLDNLVITEIKRSKDEPVTIIESKLRELKIKESSFSKYCTAVAMTEDRIKNNNFKTKIREFKKVNNES